MFRDDSLIIPLNRFNHCIQNCPKISRLDIIAGAPPTRFACGREKQVSRLTKCPIEILNLRVIPTKKRVAFGSPCYTIHQLFHA